MRSFGTLSQLLFTWLFYYYLNNPGLVELERHYNRYILEINYGPAYTTCTRDHL